MDKLTKPSEEPQPLPVDLLRDLLDIFSELDEKNRYRALGAAEYYLNEQRERRKNNVLQDL